MTGKPRVEAVAEGEFHLSNFIEIQRRARNKVGPRTELGCGAIGCRFVQTELIIDVIGSGEVPGSTALRFIESCPGLPRDPSQTAAEAEASLKTCTDACAKAAEATLKAFGNETKTLHPYFEQALLD